MTVRQSTVSSLKLSLKISYVVTSFVNTTYPDMAAGSSAHLLIVREVPSLNLVPETDFPNRRLRNYLQSAQANVACHVVSNSSFP
jgi:hypothetical protein